MIEYECFARLEEFELGNWVRMFAQSWHGRLA
jgi:hypothetical protein